MFLRDRLYFVVNQCDVVDWNWSCVRQFLPFDLDGLAVDCGVLKRRRGVAGGEALVRALLLIGLPNSTLERASRMAFDAGFSKMNGTALFNRLRRSEELLQSLYFETLKHAVDVGEKWKKYRLLAVDATALCGPGAKGINYRLHTVHDLSKGLPLSMELTGPEGGESLWRHHSFGPGDLLLCDNGYGYNKSFLWALKSKSSILIRFNFYTVTLFDPQGNRIWPEAADAAIPEHGPIERTVYMNDWPHPLRAVGGRNLEGEPRWLITNLSQEELPTPEVRELYRKRWQVELFYKRLKSLLDLDQLPTRDGPTARPWIWTKLVLAALAVLLGHERFSPWGESNQEREFQSMEGIRIWRFNTDENPALADPKEKARKAKRKTQEGQENPQATLPLEA